MQELFGAEGALKSVQLANNIATIVFTNPAEAQAALNKYNNVALDGKPMKIVKGRPSQLKSAISAALSQ